MTERELQDMIVTVARLLGWRAYHARAARLKDGSWRTAGSYDSKGFPDLLLVRDRVFFAEVKVGRNKPTPEQLAWLDGLREAGAEVYVWTEADWRSGAVEAALRGTA